MVLFKAFNKIAISRVAPMDDRPAVSDLIKKYSEQLDSLRELVSEDNPLYDVNKHDDLWLLRFILSQKKVSKAAHAARNAMQYRHELGLDFIDQFDWIGTNDDNHVPKICKAYFDILEEGSSYICQPDGDLGLIQYIHLAQIPMHQLASDISVEEARAQLRIVSEFQFRVLDEVTRRTGFLTKSIRVVDMKDMKISGFSRKYALFEGKIAKEIEDFYPQQAGTVFVFNAPSWVQYIFKTFSHFFPRRLTQKVTVLPALPENGLPDDSAVFKYISEKHLPTTFGGDFVVEAKYPKYPGAHGPPGNHGFPETPPGQPSSYDQVDIVTLGCKCID